MFWTTIGIIAAVLTTSSFIPQIIKIMRTKSAQDVSLMMILQFTVGVSFWFLYGLHLKDGVIIGANGISFLCLMVLLFLYVLYGRKVK